MSNRQTWIGLSDIENEGTFIWIDGVASTAENVGWQRGEPNDGGSNSNEDCVELNHPGHPKYTANDQTCSDSLRALCERPLWTV